MTAVARCMSEVACIPDHDVTIFHDLSADELIDSGPRERRVCGESLTVVMFGRTSIPDDPEIADAVRVLRPVRDAGYYRVPLAGGQIANSPVTVPCCVARSANLVPLRMPVRIAHYGRVVVLLDHIVGSRADVEVKAPIHVVVVVLARAGVVQ